MEYTKAYPLPHARLSYMMGTLASILWNANKGKDQAYRSWSDFFPTMDAELMAAARARPPTQAEKDKAANEVGNAFLAFNARFNKE